MKTLRMLMAAAAVGIVLIVLLTGPIRAQPDWSVIMSGLDNPRGLTFVRTGDDGDDDHGRYGRDDDGDDDDHGWALYVAEAGKGGPGPCETIRGALQCVGTTGAVSRYHRGYQERVVTGLPSYAPSTGTGATGPHDVSFAYGRGYVTIGLGGPISPVDMRPGRQ
jgi:hypothetical protein